MKGPCDSCGSSDGNHTYEDGHSYCFVCNTTTPIGSLGTSGKMPNMGSIVPKGSIKMPKGTIGPIEDRKIERATCSK